MLDFLKTNKFFTPEEVQEINYSMRYTHDVYFLSKFKSWWLFVYSCEQFTHPHMLKEALTGYIPHVAYTSCPFSLWTKQLGAESFSIALDESSQREMEAEEVLRKTELGSKLLIKKKMVPSARPERIKGDLVKVTPHMLYKLDEQHKNGVEFTRRRISVSIPFRFQYRDREDKLKVSETYWQHLMVWAYIGVQSFWDKQITDSFIFKPAKLFQPADTVWHRFYHHDKMTYDE